MGVRGIRNSYEGIIDEYTVRLIRYKAKSLIGKAGFTEADRDDLEQEMVIDLLDRLPKFDSSRAQRNTFISRIIENKALSLIEAQKAEQRDYRLYGGSLNDPVEIRDGDQAELGDTIDRDDCFQRMGRYSRPVRELNDLSLDVKRVTADLPPELDSVREQLKAGEPVSRIAQAKGISRLTTYSRLRKIRDVLKNAEFEKYF